jgi:hypothetical protein
MNIYYLIKIEEPEGEGELQFPSSHETLWSEEQLPNPKSEGGISGMLTLPTAPVRSSRPPCMEPLVDYSKAILLISDGYLTQMQQLATKRSDAANSRDARKVAIEERKRKREEERNLQLQKKKERDEAKAEKARERAY